MVRWYSLETVEEGEIIIDCQKMGHHHLLLSLIFRTSHLPGGIVVHTGDRDIFILIGLISLFLPPYAACLSTDQEMIRTVTLTAHLVSPDLRHQIRKEFTRL